MKNSTAHQALENSALKKPDTINRMNVIHQQEFHLRYLEYASPLEQASHLFFKRSFDLLASSFLLICLGSWLFPLLALLIKLDSNGPVFFFQKRHKKNGDLFTCIKFRTMIVNNNADSLPAAANDQRITRIGKILRRHHLDELAQLINVFRGDMSMVGPRPYMVSDSEKYDSLIKDYSMRYKVKPGITGLAQVVGYVNPIVRIENMEDRVRKDLYYVYNWSPVLDVKIICYTFLKMAGLNKYL